MDTMWSYLLTGAKIYNCTNCAYNRFCIGRKALKSPQNSNTPVNLHYPSMLDIQNTAFKDDTSIWCLTCGLQLSEKDQTPCQAFFCPTCQFISPIVMKEDP